VLHCCVWHRPHELYDGLSLRQSWDERELCCAASFLLDIAKRGAASEDQSE
jgi:hypothetical protein